MEVGGEWYGHEDVEKFLWKLSTSGNGDSALVSTMAMISCTAAFSLSICINQGG